MFNFYKSFKIGNKIISNDHKPYIISEIGSNFNQDLETAKKLIKLSADVGCDAVKFQFFEATDLVEKKSEYFKIFKKNELNKLWIKILKKYSEKHNLLFFVSVFNSNKINFLKKNNIDAYKVASSELSNFYLFL